MLHKVKQRQLSGYDSSTSARAEEDDEVDETFVALQTLLRELDKSRGPSDMPRPVPVHREPSPEEDDDDEPKERPSSQEELLELRRRERERFRHMLFSKTRRRCPAYYVCDEEDEDEEPAMSVESTISNRLISGSFSRLNVHVISRDRWAKEDVERLPIVLLPKNGTLSSPADNPKITVRHTKEYAYLEEQLLSRMREMPDEVLEQTRLLTPPQSTWSMQMRDFDAIKC
ncbi:hypothetical protein ATCC90586_007466 [Pythium insidiosum]|nr:hypothetical protein ATCC90586_007466 [Pythium insidiosum]